MLNPLIYTPLCIFHRIPFAEKASFGQKNQWGNDYIERRLSYGHFSTILPYKICCFPIAMGNKEFEILGRPDAEFVQKEDELRVIQESDNKVILNNEENCAYIGTLTAIHFRGKKSYLICQK